MTIGGGRSFDVIRQVAGNVINVFNKNRPAVCTSPCDGTVLQMHYKWSFWIFLGSFSSIWFSWYHKDVITCASHYNAETQVRLDYINICLSYPYTEDDHGNRRYILYYRWIHWVLLILAFVYYIPHKLSKSFENSKLKKLFEDLTATCHRYDQTESDSLERTTRYLKVHILTHNGLFFKYIVCNVVALFCDIIAFYSLDFLFQGRFFKYGIMSYPFNRNVEDFDDYMSETFPPFAKCELGVSYELTNKRVEALGCHFTVMELYEKIFFVIWLWLIVLITVTIAYIGYLFMFWLSQPRLWMLRIAKPFSANEGRTRKLVSESIIDCKIGDVYLLYRLRDHFSHGMFFQLLSRLADPKFTNLEAITIDHQQNEHDVRQRSKKQIKSPTKYHNGDGYMRNTSILVE